MSENIFGDRLRSLLEEADLEGQEFAKIIHVQPPTLSNWLNGNRFPKEREMLIKIASYFNVSLDYLLGLTDVRESKDKVSMALEEDGELLAFWNDLKEREELKLLFKQTRTLDKNAIKQVIRIIKAIEDEESQG